MSNYLESTIQGTKWVRSNSVYINNKYGQTPTITFGEEQLITMGSGAPLITAAPFVSCSTSFDPTGVITLVDTETGVPTGETVTHMKLYQILHSLYIATATARDLAVSTATSIL